MKLPLNVILFSSVHRCPVSVFPIPNTLRMDEDSVLPGMDLIQDESLLVKRDL